MSDKFIGVVVDVNDPEQAGRLKIRIYGMHDDEMNVPDDMLPWARCIYPVTNPISKGVSGPTTGVVVGTVVIGHFADGNSKQIPIIEGTLGRNSDNARDFPKASTGEDFNEVLEDNIFHIGTAELKHVKSKTIGTIEYSGQSIEKMVGFIENGQIGAALDQLREIKSQVQYLKKVITEAPIEQLNLILAGFSSDIETIIGNELDEVIVTTGAGNVIGTIRDATGEIISPSRLQLLDKITSVTGVEFSSANHLIGSIGDRLSKRPVESVEDALNRVSGSAFTMDNTMRSVEQTFDSIKQNAKRKVTDV